MTNVTASKTSPNFRPTGCPCGWGRHCRCLTAYGAELRLPELVRELLDSGSDLRRRRSAHAALRQFMELHEQRARDKVAIAELYRMLPRLKDVELVRRITCEDYSAPLTDEELAQRTRTPVEHVRDLRARVVAAYEGRPLPVPVSWIEKAKERRRAVASGRRASRRAA